ncbi:cyclophilin-like fold protein [uncultured Megamonas sp.]|uniref:cyclophilin-like fold protein n=1 Tax=uncultured Megamonas sp. TaxID=286140 RepID=UPI0025970227|nr:cyclophilin-like fold protein [uncultured Megamonas sp.]
MKKIFLLLSLLLMTFSLTACNAQVEPTQDNTTTNTNVKTATETTSSSTSTQSKIIKLTTTNNQTIEIELNNSPAANDLYNQLPLSIDLEDYSTNEKIFYPPNKLNTESTPKIGTLAYYEPWGDVVIFYDDFRANNDLYELGHVISGGDIVSELSGTVTIEAMPNQ